MNNLKLYSDEKENLSFQLALEGVSYSETKVRLCLEFKNGDNLYFKGDIDNEGRCSINIPALKNCKGDGQAIIEVIAESFFFNVHSMPFEIEKKVDVKLENLNISTNEHRNIPKVNMQVSDIISENEVKKEKLGAYKKM